MSKALSRWKALEDSALSLRVVSLTFRVSGLLTFWLPAHCISVRLAHDMANPQAIKEGRYFVYLSIIFCCFAGRSGVFGLVEWGIVVCVWMLVAIRQGIKIQPSATCLNILHSRHTQGWHTSTPADALSWGLLGSLASRSGGWIIALEDFNAFGFIWVLKPHWNTIPSKVAAYQVFRLWINGCILHPFFPAGATEFG